MLILNRCLTITIIHILIFSFINKHFIRSSTNIFQVRKSSVTKWNSETRLWGLYSENNSFLLLSDNRY